MPSEPKRPVEQMIEALAKARRGEFGENPKMPNPMRARLHEEVRARHGESATGSEEHRETGLSWLGMFWPRLAVAAAVASVLVLVPAIWWNRSHPARGGDLASSEPLSDEREEAKSAIAPENMLAQGPAAAATAAPTINLADNSQITIEPAATPASEVQALDESTRVAEARGATAYHSQVTKGLITKDVASAKTESAPAAAPPAGPAANAELDKTAGVAAPAAQAPSGTGMGAQRQFAQQSAGQSFRNKAQLNRAANVLNTFQVQQQGSEIRVLDADGSTYTGKIEQLAEKAKYAAAKQKRSYAARATGDSEAAAPQSYFRATGYNVSLKRTLVFEGNYTEPPAQQTATATANDAKRAEQRQERARIVGTARVNGEAPVEVDATEETPPSAR